MKCRGTDAGTAGLVVEQSAWESELDLWRKYRIGNLRQRVEMIGECETDILLLPEISKDETELA